MSDAQRNRTTASRAKQALQASGLSQRQLAAILRIDETKLSKSLSGRRRFAAEELLGLATAAGVTVKWLLGDDSQVSATPARLLNDVSSAVEAAGTITAQTEGEVPQEASPRRLIVEAAWDLFARRGYDAVRIADIAAAARTSSASVHYHFVGKAELFAASLDYSVKLAFDRQIAWLDDIADPRRRLERLLELQSPIGTVSHREWSIWLQTWSRLALDDAPESDYPEAYGRWTRTVRSTIEAGQRDGLIRLGDSTEMADELTSMLDGLGVKVLTGIMDASTFHQRLAAYLDRNVLTAQPLTAQPEEKSQ